MVAYKVLGAGRILPQDTLPEVFKRLARKDGICLGMFPKERDEVAENLQLGVANVAGRERRDRTEEEGFLVRERMLHQQ